MCIFVVLACCTCAYKYYPGSFPHCLLNMLLWWLTNFRMVNTWLSLPLWSPFNLSKMYSGLQHVIKILIYTWNWRTNESSMPTYVAILPLHSHVNCHLGNLDELKTRFDCGASPMPWPLHPIPESTCWLILALRCTYEVDIFLPWGP